MLNFNFSENGLGLLSSPHFVYGFSRKNVSHVTFYYLTKFHCLIFFTSRDIGQYVYYNCLKFEINLIFSIKLFRYMAKQSRQKLKYLENKNSF